MKIFPGDNIPLEQLQQYIEKLIELNKVVPYEANGRQYGWLKNFHKHQRLDKPSPPTVPLPPWVKFHGEEEFGNQRHKWYYEIIEPVGDNSGTCRGNVVDETTPEVNRREEKRSEGERNRKDSPNPPGPDASQEPQVSLDNNKNEPKYTEDSPPYRAAIYLRNRILENNPRARVPNDDPGDPLLQKWAQEMDRLGRIGPPGGTRGYSWQEIRDLIDFSQDDEFWRANILSAGKLREKCVQLENQMRRCSSKTRGDPTIPTMSKNVANALRLVEKYNQEEGGYL
ncbi:MAG: hypothetical protein GXW85_04780 [Clostridia bacterium]|nr:hypothetical protein [Clostridia bacterium]